MIKLKKTCARPHKGTRNHSEGETPSDDITLRDEILDLKRQVKTLRRTNEQYLVRLRKHEDEAKRKDRQLEHLMNPRKNAEVARVLSSKGAAILMNLKDQNNALIQMVLSRDLHIRRLVAEAKTSRLYASTTRNERCRAEISRLRHLLMRSEESLRRNVEVQPTRSISVGGEPVPEFSSSSDPSSPRELDDLRAAVMSLDSRIKLCNDLLAQRNQEICVLSDELNFLRKYVRCKAFKVEELDCGKLPSKTFTRSWPGALCSEDLCKRNALEKDESDKLGDPSALAPPDGTALRPPQDTAPARLPSATATGGGRASCEEAVTAPGAEGARSTASAVGKSLCLRLSAVHSLEEEEKVLGSERSTTHSERKWRQVFNRYKELKRLNLQKTTRGDGSLHEIPPKAFDLKAENFEKTKNDDRATEEFESEEFPPRVDGLAFAPYDKDLSTESSHSSENFPPGSDESRNRSTATYQIQLDQRSPTVNSSPDRGKQKVVSPNDFQDEDEESKEEKCSRAFFCQSLESSSDSESSYAPTQEAEQVHVQVQMDSAPPENYADPSESRGGLGEETAPDLEFNDDDDDVIVR